METSHTFRVGFGSDVGAGLTKHETRTTTHTNTQNVYLGHYTNGEVEEQEHKTDKYDKLMAFQP